MLRFSTLLEAILLNGHCSGVTVRPLQQQHLTQPSALDTLVGLLRYSHTQFPDPEPLIRGV
jgi:hypothetical protein